MAELATAQTVQDQVDDSDDKEIEAMKQRVKEMEEEAVRLREMQEEAEKSELAASSSAQAMDVTSFNGNGIEGEGMEVEEDKELADSRSVYVGNVDYGSTPEEIQAHFQSCGTINRVTILCDKFTGHPKGYAYVEFAEPAFVQHAMVLNDSLFRGRLIKVTEKRTNVPAFMRGRPPRGGYRGGYRGGGRGGGGFGYQPYRARGRGRGRGFY